MVGERKRFIPLEVGRERRRAYSCLITAGNNCHYRFFHKIYLGSAASNGTQRDGSVTASETDAAFAAGNSAVFAIVREYLRRAGSMVSVAPKDTVPASGLSTGKPTSTLRRTSGMPRHASAWTYTAL